MFYTTNLSNHGCGSDDHWCTRQEHQSKFPAVYEGDDYWRDKRHHQVNEDWYFLRNTFSELLDVTENRYNGK